MTGSGTRNAAQDLLRDAAGDAHTGACDPAGGMDHILDRAAGAGLARLLLRGAGLCARAGGLRGAAGRFGLGLDAAAASPPSALRAAAAVASAGRLTARLSLRRPGRVCGRLPSTPPSSACGGSSVMGEQSSPARSG